MIPDQGFAAPFLWGLLVLLSWIGAGALVSRAVLGRERRPDAGLCAGWGLAVTLVVGGALNALRLCSPAALATLVAAGALASLPVLVAAWRRLARDRAAARRGWIALPLAAWGALGIAASLSWHAGEINASDDLANYLMYPVRMLQTGAAIEPFNLRRIAAYGGFSFLQATIEIAGSEKNAFLLDLGLGGVVVVMLLAGAIGRAIPAAWLFVPAALAWLLLLPRVNTHVAWIAAALGITLLRTALLRGAEADPARRRGLAVVLAAVATGLCSLRANAVPFPLLFVAAVLLADLVTRRIAPREVAREAALFAAAFLLMLLPWAATSLQASGTPLYPLFKGFHRGEFMAFASGQPWGERLAVAARLFAHPAILPLLPGVLALPFLTGAAGLALSLAAVATSAVTAAALVDSDAATVSRYIAPLLAAPALFAVVALLARERAGPFGLARGAAVALALVTLGTSLPRVPATLARQAALAAVAWRDREPPFPVPLYGLHAAAQQAIPAGASLASVVDFPSLWDYRRNRIATLDFPGAVVPHGPMPFFRGATPLLEYLRIEGFDYLAMSDFTRSRGMYSRAWYASMVDSGVKPLDRASVHMLDFMANADSLAAREPVVFEGGGLRVIRLR